MIESPERPAPAPIGSVAFVYLIGAALATTAALHGAIAHGTTSLLALTFAGAVAAAHAGAMVLFGRANLDTYWSHSIGAVLHALGAGVTLAEGMRAFASVAAPAQSDLSNLLPAAGIAAVAGVLGLWLAARGVGTSPMRAGTRLGAGSLLTAAVIAASASSLPRLLGWETATGAMDAVVTLAIGTVMAVTASLLLAGTRDRQGAAMMERVGVGTGETRDRGAPMDTVRPDASGRADASVRVAMGAPVGEAKSVTSQPARPQPSPSSTAVAARNHPAPRSKRKRKGRR